MTPFSLGRVEYPLHSPEPTRYHRRWILCTSQDCFASVQWFTSGKRGEGGELAARLRLRSGHSG